MWPAGRLLPLLANSIKVERNFIVQKASCNLIGHIELPFLHQTLSHSTFALGTPRKNKPDLNCVLFLQCHVSNNKKFGRTNHIQPGSLEASCSLARIQINDFGKKGK